MCHGPTEAFRKGNSSAWNREDCVDPFWKTVKRLQVQSQLQRNEFVRNTNEQLSGIIWYEIQLCRLAWGRMSAQRPVLCSSCIPAFNHSKADVFGLIAISQKIKNLRKASFQKPKHWLGSCSFFRPYVLCWWLYLHWHQFPEVPEHTVH